MNKSLRRSTLIILLAITANTAHGAIISIGTGVALMGDRGSNLLSNGSFETRNPGDPSITMPVYWSGVDKFHTESTLQALVYNIPSWSETSGIGAYGIWGDSSLLMTDPCADGLACVYFGNWVTQPSPFPTFNNNGTVTFSSQPTFTNIDPDNQTPTTLSQTLSGLTVNHTYLLDFWASGEHYAAPFPDPGVFSVGIGAKDSVFLTTPSINSAFNANSTRYYIKFVADNPTITISFRNWGHITNSDSSVTATELILDDVIVNQISEPHNLVLLGTGLIGLYGICRRKNTLG